MARVYAEALLNAAERRQERSTSSRTWSPRPATSSAATRDFEAFLPAAPSAANARPRSIHKAFDGRADRLLRRLPPGAQRPRPPGPAAGRRGRLPRHVRRRGPAACGPGPLGRALTDDQRERLRDRLRQTLPTWSRILDETVDPELLGGLVRAGRRPASSTPPSAPASNPAEADPREKQS